MTRAHSNPRLPPSAALFDRPPPHFSTGAYSGIEVEAADELATKLPHYIRADQLDERVVNWLIDEANQPQLQREIEEALKDVIDRRGKLVRQREALHKQIQAAEAKHERLKRRAVDLVMDEQPALLVAVNEELQRSADALAEMQTRLADLGAAQKRLDEAAADASQVTDHIALIRKAWQKSDRTALRELLRKLIKQVDVRADELIVRIYALPKMRVYELGDKVALTGRFGIPRRLRHLTRRAAC